MRKWVWDWFSIWEFQDNTFKPKAGVVATATAKSLQSCPTLCDPTDGSPSGSPVPGILQARTLEWVAISFSSAQKWRVKVKLLSRVQLLVTPWTAAYQALPSMGFSRQEYLGWDNSIFILTSFVQILLSNSIFLIMVHLLYVAWLCKTENASQASRVI